MTLAPDAYLVTSVDGFEDYWFLEVDLGTESAATLARKLAVYRGYWQSGTEEAARGVFPRVLWLVPDEARAGVLATVIVRQPTAARSLFAVSRAGDVVARLRRGAA